MELLEKCGTQAERKMIYSSIGSCPTEALKKKVLNWAVSSVKLQDFFYPLGRYWNICCTGTINILSSVTNIVQ